MSQKLIREILKAVESSLNATLPGTDRRYGGRVRYLVIPGRGVHRRMASRRAGQVLRYLEREHGATAAQIERDLKINRNAIAGAVFRLREQRLIKSVSI